MTSSPLVRWSAITAPILLFVYGTFRLIDGLDGHHDKDGFLWKSGHVLFFIGFALFGALAAGIRGALRNLGPAGRTVANVATVAAVFGAACFLWVTVGDLSESFQDSASLPEWLQIVGPVLFQLGVLTLLGQLVRARMIPAWSPVAMFLGFIAIAVSLDLIPVASLVVLIGLLPVAGVRLGRRPTASPLH